tara:strand:+ start:1549 stop:2835 length:1287 start_codon:yes stop_codon:yes gene_type:complete
MNPSSQIKQQLKDKLKFDSYKKEETLIESKESISLLDSILTPSKPTPKTISILSLLENTKKKKYNNSSDNTFYNYPIDFLNKDINSLNIKKIESVNLCIFNVQTKCVNPFLIYLLNKQNDMFYWPSFKPQSTILNESNEKIEKLNLNSLSQFEGYIYSNNSVYMFYKIQDNFNYSYYYQKSSDFWWVSMYEILFSQQVLYFSIHKSIYNLFIKESRLQYLLDKKNLYIEIPIIGYNGSHIAGINYQIKIGLMKGSIQNSSQGPFFYFANYMRGAKFGAYNVVGGFKELEIGGDILTDNQFGRYKEGGIIRFVIFLGKQKVVFDRKWDKENKMTNEINGFKYGTKIDIKRIYDPLGSWIKEYNSVLVGPIEISKDTRIHNGSSITVKDYFQYQSLSCHYLDKKTIPEKYNPEIDRLFWKPELSEYFRIK